MLNQNKSTDVFITKFYLHKIEFTPKKGVLEKTNDILTRVITFLNQEKTVKNRVYLIDRHHNRKDVPRRELFMYSAVFIPKKKRIKCSIALIDDRKKPMIKPKDTYDLIPFDTAAGSITELTHFFIDLNVSPAVMCVEFNNNGPRISDIEYYFRNIAHKKLFLATATTTTTFMNSRIDNTLESLLNVTNFEFKLKPQSVTHMDNDVKGYITGVATMGNKLQPKYIKVEAMYQTPGAKVQSDILNKEGNNLARLLLNKFKTRPFHIELLEDFELKYINKDGEDAVFNLLKGKEEILIEIGQDEHLNTTQWYSKIEEQFDQFIDKL